EIYLQPKLNIQVNKMCGAEALVRWRHPIRGLLSPGEFIPVFERNGFIIKLDYYVWEQVCKCLRRWLDEGKTPYPISVNVSRVNLYNPKLAELILQLVKKYNLSPSLLNLELTESAYTDNPIAASETIALLQSYGFVILMDDFGSGYSSLNILKDISVDELKIDMRFLSETKIPGRGENIIASVVRMAKWLNIPVVTEGVETKEQTDFLRSIGCDCIQGYYYAKPMKVSEYEDLCNRQFIGLNPIEKQVDGQYQYDEIFAQNPEMTKLFINSYKAAAIYEFSADGIELLRVNNIYYTLFGQHAMTENTRDLLAAVDTEYKDIVQQAFATCVKTKKPTECEYVRRRADGLPVWAHVELAYVSKIGDKSIVSGVLTDNTLKKEIEKELQNYREALLSQHDDTNTILIVDDAVTNRIILKKIFEPQFKILEAENGEEAMKILKEKMEEIDLILLDIMMPVMDGREFLKQKQKIPMLDDTPVMIITADDSDAQQVEALSLGARDYIVKPFNAELVVRRVKNVMGFSRQFKEMAREYSNMSELVKKDPMTGLLNRISAQTMITQHLENTSDIHAMMMLDVDNFKNINDTYGHVIGDEVICAVAKRLKLFFRQSDIVARMGGDEFSVFIGHIPEDEVAEKKAIELCRSMADIVIGDENMRISCSVGVAVSNSDEDTFETLYVNADKALYNAKCNGKGSVSVFGKDDAEFFVKRISDAEGILNDIQDSLLICSLETNSILYANDYVCKQLGSDKKDVIGRKCYEVLMGAEDYCKGCPKNKPNQTDISGRLLHYSKSGKTFMLRGKYINWNGIPAYMELAVDVTDIDMCHVTQG
ncbi:MAG: EAL domain-containing protein, partial [Oscillospiraceae bacterium]